MHRLAQVSRQRPKQRLVPCRDPWRQLASPLQGAPACLSLPHPHHEKLFLLSLPPSFRLRQLYSRSLKQSRVLYSLRSFFRVAVRINAFAHLCICTHFANHPQRDNHNPPRPSRQRETIATTVLLKSRCSSELPPLLPSWPAPPASVPSPSRTAWP